MRKVKDYSNLKIGRLSPLFSIKSDKGYSWCCACDCGNYIWLLSQQLSGRIKSCGCICRPNLLGKKYNKLTVVGNATKKYKDNRYYYECKCECGKIIYILKHRLQKKKVKSCGCHRLTMDEYSLIRNVICNYKNNAKKKNLSFKLTEQDCAKLFKSSCYYCGAEYSNICKGNGDCSNLLYNGIDRINNKMGYIISNCVACCKTCNRRKSDTDICIFMDYVVRIYNNRIKK